MDFRFSEDEQMLHNVCSRFAKEQLAQAGAEADRQKNCPADLLAKGLELGLFLDAIPSAQGGYLEGAYSHTNRAIRALALSQGCAGVTMRFEANTEFALAAAALDHTEALKQLANSGGQTLAAVAFADAIKPVDCAGGKLNGKISAVPNAVGAAWLAIVSHTNAQIPFVAIVKGSDVKIEPDKTMGLTASAVGTISLSNVLPDKLLSGAEANALAKQLRNSYRVLAGAIAVGAALISLDYAEKYAAERIQFGQPIGKFQALARLIAENRARLQAAKYLVLAAAQALDHGQDATTICQDASSVAGEAATRAAIDAVQVYGGYGFVNDYPVEKIMRDVRASTTLAGDGLREQVYAASVLA